MSAIRTGVHSADGTVGKAPGELPPGAGDELMQVILANLFAGVVLARASDGTILFASPRFSTMFGYEYGELEGKPVSILNAPRTETPEEDRSWRWNLDPGRAVERSPTGEPLRMVGTDSDLSEQRWSGLREFTPICAGCKSIRDEDGTWQAVELHLGSGAWPSSVMGFARTASTDTRTKV